MCNDRPNSLHAIDYLIVFFLQISRLWVKVLYAVFTPVAVAKHCETHTNAALCIVLHFVPCMACRAITKVFAVCWICSDLLSPTSNTHAIKCVRRIPIRVKLLFLNMESA